MHSLRSSFHHFVFALIAILLMQTSLSTVASAKPMQPEQAQKVELGLTPGLIKQHHNIAKTEHPMASTASHLSAETDCQHTDSTIPQAHSESNDHAHHAGKTTTLDCEKQCDCCNAHHTFTLALINAGNVEQPSALLNPQGTLGQPSSYISPLLRPPTA